MKSSQTLATLAAVALLFLTALNSAWLMFCISAIGLVVLVVAGPFRRARFRSLMVVATAFAVAFGVALLIQLW